MENGLLFLWALQQYEGRISSGCTRKSVCSGFVQGIFGLLGEIFERDLLNAAVESSPFFHKRELLQP